MRFALIAKKNLSISKQLLLGVVISSSLITFVVTILQIFQEHQSQVQITIGQFDTLMHTNKKGLENSIWDLNETQINSILEGMNNFSKIDYLSLKYDSEDGETTKTLGNKNNSFISKDYELFFNDKRIGSLSFHSDKKRIFEHLQNTLLYILFINFLKTFIASFLILYVINYLLTRHLLDITNYLKNGDNNENKLTLNRRASVFSNDELSHLTNTINSLIDKSQQSTNILEKKVKQRTVDLEKARKKSLEAVKTKSQFLANISHELRTPLNGIIGIIDNVLYSCPDEKLKKQLHIVEKCGSTLLNLINDILDISKMEEGKLRLENIPFEVWENVDQVINLLKLKSAEKDNDLQVSINNDIPKIIFGDPTRFKQVLMNLVNNSIKFTQHGKISIHITGKKSQDDEWLLQIDVEDTGIGIDEENLDQIFEPFIQEDSSTSRLFGGSGLGLSISKSIVKQMGGDIWVKSKKGKGSTFSFNFTTKKSYINPNLRQDQTKNKLEVSNIGPLSILLAEDNEINQIVFQSLLERLGYSCDTCFNGKEVLEKVKKKNYDLIFMDCQMPIMNGFETAREIVKRKRRPKIIALTASALKEDKDKCFLAGMDDFVSKPIRIKDLENCLIKLVSVNS